MKVKRTEGSQERAVLIGMIVDRAVLGSVASRWTESLFSSRWANIVGKWCVEYYRRYKKCPGEQIQNIFDEWANEGGHDKETVQLVEKFLASVSGEYARLKDTINADYTIDLASAYFTKQRLKQLSDEIAASLEEGDIDAADAKVHQYHKVDMAANSGIDVLGDEEAIRRTFDFNRERLIEYRHGLGIFFGDALERDGFVSLMGPEKRGKTWALMDLAWHAMLQNRRVAFFEVGDLSEHQIMRRFMIRAAKRPGKPRTVLWPTHLTCEKGDKIATVEHEERTFKTGIDFDTAWAACQRILKKRSDIEGPLLRLSVHPNSSVSVHGIQAIIDVWEREDWIPDVVVIDYADILAPPRGVTDPREQINTIWKALRALSQSLHCLVLTATQAKATSYTADTLGMQDYSEDKRKFAHVTGMVGLNRTNEEKRLGIMRYNWISLREDEYSPDDCCHVASCVALGNPAVLSVMMS